jgi:capsular exopolysaccharide synthesis family protein
MQDYNKSLDKRGDISVAEFFSKYLSYWKLFLVLLIVSIAGAWLYLKYAVPVYESSATILIKDEKKGANDSKMVEDLDQLGSNKVVDNELEVITSRTLAKAVVKQLHLYAPVLIKKGIGYRSAYTASPVQIEAQNPDKLANSEDKPEFTYNEKNQQVRFDGKNYALNQWFQSPYGVLRFIPNNVYDSTGGTNFYFSISSISTAVSQIQNNLKATNSSKSSSVIELKQLDEVPKRGEDILNTLIEEYSNAAIKDKNELAENTLLFVENRLKYVVYELDSVEQKLENFRTRNGIVNISAQGQLFLQNVGTNDQKVSEINSQLAVLDQVESYVLSKNGKGGIVPSTLGVTDPVLSQLLDKLYDAEIQYEKLKNTTAENNPLLVAVKDQIEKIRPSVLENVRNQRKSLLASRENIHSTNGQYTSMLQTLPQKERELLDISRQQSIKNDIYTFLLHKREEAALSYASTVSDSRVVDRAESYGPVSPKVPIVFLTAIVAGFALGFGYISIKLMLSRTVQSRGEIELNTTEPILGEIPYNSSKSSIVIAEGEHTFIAEQFRQLRTSLGYLGINSRKKKIMVTSAISNEGKSFVAANLGISLALIGKRVVLVDLDLRRPKLGSVFNVTDTIGLSDYLMGNRKAEEIICPTQMASNLYVISSGPIPANPSELIMNGKLNELFSFLENSFDYIIIDTTPVGPVTDAYIISPMCDATLFVVRRGVTPVAFLKKLEEDIKVKKLNNLAIIYNGLKQSDFGKHGYRYVRSYSYTNEAKANKRRKRLV